MSIFQFQRTMSLSFDSRDGESLQGQFQMEKYLRMLQIDTNDLSTNTNIIDYIRLPHLFTTYILLLVYLLLPLCLDQLSAPRSG
jgi:hypothetical protein